MKVKNVLLLTLVAFIEGFLKQHSKAWKKLKWNLKKKSAFEYIPRTSVLMLQSLGLSKWCDVEIVL